MNIRDLIPASRRTLLASIGSAAVLGAVLVWAVPRAPEDLRPALSSGSAATASPSAETKPSGKAVAPSRATVKSRPPARLFAGGESAVGVLVRVCEGGKCTSLPRGNPKEITVPSGTPMAFALAQKPEKAWVERVSPGGSPARETLEPGTLIAYTPRAAPGRYQITLNVRFGDGEARWVFGLKVTA